MASDAKLRIVSDDFGQEFFVTAVGWQFHGAV